MILRDSSARREGIDQVQSARRTVHHGHGDGMIQFDDRGRLKPEQYLVQTHNLQPIRAGAVFRLSV